ncbi:MAG: hypothetical protein ACJ74Q_10515 [Pyrinomonadaceae bacterium]
MQSNLTPRRVLAYSALWLSLLIISASSVAAQQCGVHCGTERWKIKTLTDTTVDLVEFDPVVKPINWLRTRTRPNSLPNTTRLVGIETMTFKVTGVVLKFKLEDDRDFHVVIAQSNNHARTMIVEFPNIECSDVCSSEFADQIRQARDDFVARFGQPTTSFTTLDHPVRIEVTGVGFFDRMHGQTGRALPSGIELHPVIGFRVLD